MQKDDVFVFAQQTGGTETKRESARDYGRRRIKGGEERRYGAPHPAPLGKHGAGAQAALRRRRTPSRRKEARDEWRTSTMRHV